MTRSRLVVALASVFAGLATVMVVLAAVYRTPVPLFVAGPFGLTAYLMWHRGSGAGVFPGRVRWHRGPRDDGGRRVPPGARRRGRSGTRGPRTVGRSASGQAKPSLESDYRVLGLEPGADQAAIRRAYREKAKETHPDADGGDHRAFKRLTEAYDRLRE